MTIQILQAAAQAAGIQNNTLAQMLGITRQTLWLWRKGTHRPSHRHLRRMYAVYEQIVGGTPDGQ